MKPSDLDQDETEAREWYRKHKHKIPAAIPYDRYSESVQRAITRTLQSAKNFTGEDSPAREDGIGTCDNEQLPDNTDEKRSAVERSVESTRFDRTGQTFKELGDGGDGTEGSPLTKAVEGLAGGRYSEAIEAFFRSKDGETCREIAESSYIRDGKTGLQVHPRPGTVRKWIDRVETWINCVAEEHGLAGELKARFLIALEQTLQQLNRHAQWSRLQSELRGEENGSGPPAGRAKLISQSGPWWETSDQPNLRQTKPRPEPSPNDEPEEEDAATWQDAKTLAGGCFWNNRPIPNGRFAIFAARELTPDDPEYRQLREHVKRQRSESPAVEIPKTTTTSAVEPSRTQVEALKKDHDKIAEAQALRNTQPKILLTPKQTRAKVVEDGLLVGLGLGTWPQFRRKEFCDIVDFIKDGRDVADIAETLKRSQRTVEARIGTLKKLAQGLDGG